MTPYKTDRLALPRTPDRRDNAVTILTGIAGLGLYGVAIGLVFCTTIGSRVLAITGPGRPGTFYASLTGVACVAIFGVAVCFICFAGARIIAWRNRWARCVHGIFGGDARGRCKKCSELKQAAQNAHRREAEEAERRRKIEIAAKELRARELSRLRASLLPSLEQLRRLSPRDFENEIAAMFRRLGYTVEQTPYSNDHGRDAIMWKDGAKYLLECKRYNEDGVLGRPVLQQFLGAITADKAKGGFFVTTGSFPRTAIDFAAKLPIELLSGEKLRLRIFESKPAGSSNDGYNSICDKCGGRVCHLLHSPHEEVYCQQGHIVPPTLSLNQVLGIDTSPPPTCRCGSSMRVVNGRRGKFWGCTKYPSCRSTKPFQTTNPPFRPHPSPSSG